MMVWVGVGGGAWGRDRGRGLGMGRECGRGCGRGRGHGHTVTRGRCRGRVGTTLPSDPNQQILEAVWKREESNALVHDFCGNAPGPSRSVSSTETAMEAFCKYFTDEVWDLLVVETNRFAARCKQTPTTSGVRS